MTRFDGTLARQLDFDSITTTTFRSPRVAKASLKPVRAAGHRGPDKYRELEHRRRQAQIQARRLLGLF
jgi:hypothetical protein